MSDTMKKNSTEAKGTGSVVAAAVTGAVIGAGVVVAGVMAMKNDKNRAKAKEVIDGVKAKASTYMQGAQEQVDEGKAKIEKTVATAKESNQKVQKIWQK